MLSRATYPDVWDRHAYPANPVVAADFGTVVHGAVERLLDAFAEASITSPQGAEAVALLRSMGGFKAVVRGAIEARLASYEGNPRVTPVRLERLGDELWRRCDEACDQVKAFLGRGALPAGSYGLLIALRTRVVGRPLAFAFPTLPANLMFPFRTRATFGRWKRPPSNG